MKSGNISKIIISILLCQAAGIVGSFFTVKSIPTWYALLAKPPINPPNWLFGPVWLILYFLMALSLYLVWQDKSAKEIKKPLFFFFGQLALNTLWSIIFFGWQNLWLAFLEIILLWFFILLTIFEFNKLSKKAAILLIPYILWVSFAALLNFLIWRLNP